MAGLTRSQLASAAGCNQETVRHYERAGLLAEPPRSPGGHRRYDEDAVARLSLIVAARNLGLPLNAVRRLLDAFDDAGQAEADVSAVTLDAAALVQARLADIEALVAALAELNDPDPGEARTEAP